MKQPEFVVLIEGGIPECVHNDLGIDVDYLFIHLDVLDTHGTQEEANLIRSWIEQGEYLRAHEALVDLEDVGSISKEVRNQ